MQAVWKHAQLVEKFSALWFYVKYAANPAHSGVVLPQIHIVGNGMPAIWENYNVLKGSIDFFSWQQFFLTLTLVGFSLFTTNINRMVFRKMDQISRQQVNRQQQRKRLTQIFQYLQGWDSTFAIWSFWPTTSSAHHWETLFPHLHHPDL